MAKRANSRAHTEPRRRTKCRTTGHPDARGPPSSRAAPLPSDPTAAARRPTSTSNAPQPRRRGCAAQEPRLPIVIRPQQAAGQAAQFAGQTGCPSPTPARTAPARPSPPATPPHNAAHWPVPARALLTSSAQTGDAPEIQRHMRRRRQPQRPAEPRCRPPAPDRRATRVAAATPRVSGWNRPARCVNRSTASRMSPASRNRVAARPDGRPGRHQPFGPGIVAAPQNDDQQQAAGDGGVVNRF